MVMFTPGTQRSDDIISQAVGVFEDDALLLRLASRSRFADRGYSRASTGSIDLDDLAIEVAHCADAQKWEM